jgi:ribosomal protein L40E
MELAEGIRRVGFARWYERQLMEAHVYLVTAFLCLILLTACLEGFNARAPGVEPLLRLVGMLAGTCGGVWAVRRYGAILGIAERAAGQSVCKQCAAYGRLEVIGAGMLAPPAKKQNERTGVPLPHLAVRCRKCGHEWMIE